MDGTKRKMLALARERHQLQTSGSFVNRRELREFINLAIENVSNSLEVIKKSMAKVDSLHSIVDGISIFCDWETYNHGWR